MAKEIRIEVPGGADLYAVAVAGFKLISPGRFSQAVMVVTVTAYTPEQARQLALNAVTAKGEAFFGDEWDLQTSVCTVKP